MVKDLVDVKTNAKLWFLCKVKDRVYSVDQSFRTKVGLKVEQSGLKPNDCTAINSQ